ncbi:hypothetical protein PC117_g4967 [Phytophthora cactorum]|uniref:Uncharacterized protein n=1 Tax=Phytophthora cactorum TaxID=29920 RepID=A0A8T1E991_9STRA|nr:hypothetical protein PC117_g4967 [Phytophthora cactorum]
MKNGGTAQTAAANRLCATLKWGNWNVVDSMSLELNGKTIVSMADYKLFWNDVRAQTGYTTPYVEKHGAESFLFPDAGQSVLYSAAAATTGDAYSNNTAFTSALGVQAQGGATIPIDGFVEHLLLLQSRTKTARGAFVAGATTANAIMGTWTYILKIKLTDLHPIFRELDLMANPQIRLRFRVNQGTAAIAVDASKNMSLTSTTLSSGNTCPVMVASAATGNPMAGVLTASAGFSIAWGAVVNSLEPTIDGTYMPFTTARLYVPFVHLENPQAIISKPVKKVRYNDCYAQWFNQRAGTGKSTTQLFFLSLSRQPGSSIRNFNVRIGSTQVFDISHDYDSHHFTNEVTKIAAINGDMTPELVNGLLDYQTWSLTNRMLIADVSRLTERDISQSIQIQGTNAGCQGVNLLVLVISDQELSYDRLTGEVIDYTTA